MKIQFHSEEPTFRVGSINIQKVRRPAGYSHSFRAGRPDHAFIYVVSGTFCATVHRGGQELTATAGDLVFMPMGTVYTGTYAEEGTEIRIVQFDLLSGALPDYLASPARLALPNAGALVDAFFARIEDHTVSPPFYCLSCLYRLLFEIDECQREIPQRYKRLAPALGAIAEGWRENAPVSYYAALCDMSEVTFRRLFREYIGASPVEYRNGLRLSRARAKLQSGEYNVSETAALCGFSNLSFFTRLYKKKYGHTPKGE